MRGPHQCSRLSLDCREVAGVEPGYAPWSSAKNTSGCWPTVDKGTPGGTGSRPPANDFTCAVAMHKVFVPIQVRHLARNAMFDCKRERSKR